MIFLKGIAFVQDLIFPPVEGWVHPGHELVRRNDCVRHKSKFCIGVMLQFKTRLHHTNIIIIIITNAKNHHEKYQKWYAIDALGT